MVVVKVAGVTSVLDLSMVSPILMNSTKYSGVRLTVSFISPTLVSIFSSLPTWCQALTSTWSTPNMSLVLLIQLGADGLVPDQFVGLLGGVELLLLELLSIHHALVLEVHLAHQEVLVLLVVHDLGVAGSVGEALANLP